MLLAPVWATLQFLAWPRLQPGYSALVSGAADAALGIIEAGERVTRLRTDGRLVHVRSDLREDGQPATTYDADVLHFYMVLIVSLILVYPGPSARRRALMLGIGILFIFLFHVAVLLLNVEHMYAVTLERVSSRNYTDAERTFHSWLMDAVDHFAVQLVPAAALLFLFLRHGLGERRAAEPAPPGVPRRRAAMTAAVLLLAAGGAVAVLHGPKVRARQAEKQCALGYREMQAGDLEGAAQAFASAVSRRPAFVEAREGLGLVRMRQGRAMEARDLFESLVRDDPGRHLSHLHLGNALYQLEAFEAAGRAYAESARLAPDSAEPAFNLSRALRSLGRREEAEQVLARLLDRHPDHRDALFQISASLIASGRACGALPHLLRLRELGPGSERAALVAQTIEDLREECELTRSRP